MTDRLIDLRQRLANILADLAEGGGDDGKAMFMLGSTATRICDLSKVSTWAQCKAALKPNEYPLLVTRIGREGEQFLAEGNTKAAYALQAIGMSLVAGRELDSVLNEGVNLLDSFIEQTITNYRAHAQPHLRKAN
jgi:hypothetical protein